jgi:hypothetical protein
MEKRDYNILFFIFREIKSDLDKIKIGKSSRLLINTLSGIIQSL